MWKSKGAKSLSRSTSDKTTWRERIVDREKYIIQNRMMEGKNDK